MLKDTWPSCGRSFWATGTASWFANSRTGKWNEADAIETPETADVFRPSAAYDNSGTLHIVWPAQVNGNWDLYARHKTATGWSAIERVTQNPGSDFHQKLIADPQGNLWLAWQSFRNGQSDVYVKEYRAGAWGGELRISESSANDWEPALAAANDGTLWVGWDTYEKGDYDVMVEAGRSAMDSRDHSPAPSPNPRGSRRTLHRSPATSRNRLLWVAFDESTANWGKDYGYLEKTKGNPLYISRRKSAWYVWTAISMEEPAADIAAAFPLYVSRFVQNPQVLVNQPTAAVVGHDVAADEIQQCDRGVGSGGNLGERRPATRWFRMAPSRSAPLFKRR